METQLVKGSIDCNREEAVAAGAGRWGSCSPEHPLPLVRRPASLQCLFHNPAHPANCLSVVLSIN